MKECDNSTRKIHISSNFILSRWCHAPVRSGRIFRRGRSRSLPGRRRSAAPTAGWSSRCRHTECCKEETNSLWRHQDTSIDQWRNYNFWPPGRVITMAAPNGNYKLKKRITFQLLNFLSVGSKIKKKPKTKIAEGKILTFFFNSKLFFLHTNFSAFGSLLQVAATPLAPPSTTPLVMTTGNSK